MNIEVYLTKAHLPVRRRLIWKLRFKSWLFKKLWPAFEELERAHQAELERAFFGTSPDDGLQPWERPSWPERSGL